MNIQYMNMNQLQYTVKKVIDFPVPSLGCYLRNSPWRGIIKNPEPFFTVYKASIGKLFTCANADLKELEKPNFSKILLYVKRF